jgi:ribosomal protein L40E
VIVCTNCGHENADDAEFCESCQGFLEWTGKKVEEPESGETEPEAASVVASETATVTAGPEAALQAAPELKDREQPDAIRPATQHVPPPRRRPTPAVEPEPGELICDQCGSGNRAEANFCRRCGASLEGASVARRPPWWRRLFTRTRRTYAAGERRRGARAQAKTGVARVRSGFFQVMQVLAVLSILGIVSVGVWRGDLIDRGRDALHRGRVALFPHYESVLPNAFRATSSLRHHHAGAAFDDVRTTFWAEGAPGNGRGQKLIARFDRLVDVSRVGVYLGDQSKPQNFAKQPVPHRLRLAFFDRHGRRIASKVLFLAETPDFQRFSVDAPNTTRMVATIVSVFQSAHGHSAAITEITVFEKH